MKVCLYIAEHLVTGLKYFGKTTRWFSEEDLQKNYHGSGTYWKNHLDIYGDYVSMKVLGVYSIFEQSDDFVKPIAIKFSKENNIVESKEWANVIDENGLDGWSFSENDKQKISERMRGKVVVIDKNTNKIFQTDIDTYKFYDNLVAFSKGQKRKKKRQCHHCNKFLYPSEEMYHFDYCENNPNKMTREVNCKFCDKTFKDSTGCKNHELLCDKNPDKLSFECSYCNKVYKDLRNKIRHENTCNKNKDKKQYFCEFCDKELKNNSALIKHQNICTKNINSKKLIYKCSFCDREFKNSKINLINHEKHYCKSNPNVEKLEFKCECGKIYSDKGNFSQHKNKCNFKG